MDKNEISKIKKRVVTAPSGKVKIMIDRKGELCFLTVRGEDAYREDEAPGDRQSIMAIVKHHTEDKYLLLKWNKVAWYTFVTGGIEEGQTAEEAARVEILEETGYKNLKLIKKLSNNKSKFYHIPKQENRAAHFQNFLFQLENDERGEVTEEEKIKHTISWVAREKVDDLLTADAMKYIWMEI